MSLRRARFLWLPTLGLLGAACGPGAKTPLPPPGSEQGKLGKPLDVPPPAAAVKPIPWKDIQIAADITVRRPLVPMPSAIGLKAKPKGTVDDSGDETPLADILIGTGAKDQTAIDSDSDKLPGGVRLVIDSPYEIFSKVGTYIHVAAWLPSFQPAANARVFVDGKLRGRTDASGTLVFRDVPDPNGAGGGSHAVAVISGEAKAPRIIGGANYNAYARTQSFERANLYVYTDRGVFNPGETVHVRAFAWRLRGDYRPFADAPVNVLLRRDGKVVSGGRVQTDKMGIAWLDLPLPSNAPEGAYELAVEHLGERSTARLQIKRIVAPTVRIEHTLPRFLTRDAKDLDFEVTLAASTGEAFKSGTVTIKCLDPKGAVVGTEVRAVTGNGPHKFALDGEKLKKMRDAFGEDQLAAVIVDVKDGATGRSDELRRDLRISKTPWRLVVETDRNEHVPGETVKVVVHTTDLEQAPTPGMDLEIVGLGYANEDETGKPAEKKVVVKTDADGLARATFTMPKGSLNITATMVKAKSVTASNYVYASPPRAMFADIASPTVTEKAKTPVEIKFPSQYLPAEKVVHADVVDSSGALIHSFLVPIGADGVARGTFPAPSWGSMLITFFALGVEKGKSSALTGLLTDGANLPVVASRPITVTLKAPSTAAPGQKLAFDVTLDGPKGNGPRPFAIGAVIADDSMLALLDPLERTPTQVLYNPERKVMASTGSQILTWPVVQKTWGSWNYDIALPPFGFRPGGVPPSYGPNKKKSAGNKYDESDGDSYGYGGIGATGTGAGGGGYGAGAAAPKAVEAKPAPMPTMPAKVAGAPPPPPMEAAAKDLATKSPAAQSPPGAAKAPEVKISIRTDFAPTSFWMPEQILEAPKGKEPSMARFEAKLPDTIGSHRVTVVATDDRGAIGIGKAIIKVDQDVSVRSDLPPALTQGDETEVSVAVRNTKKTGVSGAVTLTSAGLTLLDGSARTITVGPQSSGAVKFKVRANAAGATAFAVSFNETGSGATLRNDTEQRVLWVHPRGVPVESRTAATLGSGKALTFEVEREANDAHVEADLAIAFPSAVPMIEGLDELVNDETYLGVDPDASRLLATIALEGYLLRTGAPALTVARVHNTLQLAAASLLLEQQTDGGWGWRWDTWAATHGLGPASSAYATTHALHALAKLRDTNVPVPDAAIASGRTFLLRALDQNDEVDVSNVAFWEGDGPAKKRAATMAAFQAIAATEKGQPLYGDLKTKMERLVDKARAITKGAPGAEDPLTLSSATMGLWLHARATNSVNKEDVETGIRALLASYRGGYWEPSWFHAWGGRIEATRGVIELLTTAAPGAFDAELHDAVNFLLQTRPSWGAWHNAWGTAAAIEALTFLDPTPPEKAGANVAVSVDGKVVRTVKIDPDDPFVSAAALRAVDLSPYLTVGKHEVSVAYDGNLAAPTSVTVKRWNPTAKVGTPDLKLDRTLSTASVTAGGVATATVKITSTLVRAELTLSVPLPAGVSVDRTALEAMMRDGTIAAFHEGASLVLSLRNVPVGSKDLKLPLIAARRGTFALAPVRAFAPRASAEAFSEEAKLAVQ